MGRTVSDTVGSTSSICQRGVGSPWPMPSWDLSIAFNGCIYHYADLRSELATLGYEFFSNSDTKTILKANRTRGASAI